MNTLGLEQLIALNMAAINKGGGSSGVRSVARLESVVASQTQAVFGEDLHKTIFDKAAAIIRGIVQDHPFVDGNKRTAMLAGLSMLDINGVNISLDAGEVENFAVKIAVENLSVEEIASWLKSHSKED
jgi:death-on-curing protein